MSIESESQREHQDAQALAPDASGNQVSDYEMMAPHRKVRLQRYYIDVDDAVFE